MGNALNVKTPYRRNVVCSGSCNSRGNPSSGGEKLWGSYGAPTAHAPATVMPERKFGGEYRQVILRRQRFPVNAAAVSFRRPVAAEEAPTYRQEMSPEWPAGRLCSGTKSHRKCESPAIIAEPFLGTFHRSSCMNLTDGNRHSNLPCAMGGNP